MKKNNCLIVSMLLWAWKRKLVFIMRLTFSICLLCVLQSFAIGTFSQNFKLSINQKNISVESVIQLIEDKTDYYFMYSGLVVDVKRTVNLDMNNKTVPEILDEVFKNTDVTYKINGRLIALNKDGEGSSMVFQKQSITISGKISDSSGSSLPGVTVVVKGTTQGTITDTDGNYSLSNVPDDGTLVFSFVGMRTQEIPVAGKASINVTMAEETIGIEEVVAVGYGKLKKSDLTGSVVRADINKFEESTVLNITDALHGAISGLSIGQVDESGENPGIQIRGRNTLSGSTSVLIVLDGIIFRGSLSDLNPNDIKSVDILKDASSKAVYGANAANGVILITTKQGKKSSKPIFSYKGSFATQTPSNSLPMLNREQSIQKMYDMAWENVYQAPDYTTLKPEVKLEDTGMYQAYLDMVKEGKEYNWWGNCTSPGYINSHTISVQANKDNFAYYVSGEYTKQKGYILNDEFERISMRTNLSSNIFSWFEIGTQTNLSLSDYSGSSPSISGIRVMSPAVVPYDETGEIIINPMGDISVNPYLSSTANDFDKRNHLFSNIYASIDMPFLPGLNYRLNFGNNYSWDRHYYSSEYNGQIKTGQAYKSNAGFYEYTLDNILSYVRTFNKHSLNLTMLYGIREGKYEYTNASANTFSSIRLGYNDLSLGEIKSLSSSAWKESYLYQMGRVVYNYDSRYLISATLRRDGFSGFAANNKFALFPSVGLGWDLSNENFFNVQWVEQLKLRVSSGANGNLTSRYSSLAKMNQYTAYVFGDGSSTVYGQEPTTLSNDDLEWEQTFSYNYGLDFSILKNRLSGSIEYYTSVTKDLLYNVNIPSITGFSSITTNVGRIENNGFELQLSSRLIQSKDFRWNIDFNISANKNKVKSILGVDSDNDGVEDDLVASNLFIGHPIGAVYTYLSDGIIQIGDDVPEGFSIGTHRIVNTNDDDVIDPNDRVIIGHTEPAYQFGISNEFIYKDFSLKFFIHSIQGGKDGYLGSMAPPSIWYSYDNIGRQNNFNIDYWIPNNPNGKYDVPGSPTKIKYGYYKQRSFIRLQDIILAYNITPAKINKIGLQSARVFLSGKNLLTLTKWGGWDPETGAGLGMDSRPVLKSMSIGVEVSL